MRIQNNIMALNTHRQYGINNASISKSTEKLSSGYRINRAGDDAAGLAISEKMRAQIRGLTMASKNSQDAISLVQTAEGALQESHNILQRMRELAVQSASDTNETTIDRSALQQEFSQLIKELDDTASKAKFNDQGLIDGTFSKTITAASTTNVEYGMAWADSKVEASTTEYTIEATSTEIVSEVAAAVGTASNTTAFSFTSSAGAITAAWTTAADSDMIGNAKMNGNWNFGMSDGKIVATNDVTGEKISRSFASVAAGDGSVAGAATTLDFGPLGKIALTKISTGDADANSFTGVSGTVKIADAVSARAAVHEHSVTLGSDQIVLQSGQTTLNFVNTGISVTLKNALTVDNTDGTAMTDLNATIEVAKNQGKELVIQTGANQHDELAINIGKMDAYTLGVASSNVSNRLDASNAITQVNTAVNIVSTQRAALGALQNRLDHKISNLDTSAENLTAAESRIRDVDMAKEMTTFTKNNILFQASTAMLAQANAAPQGVLQLLG